MDRSMSSPPAKFRYEFAALDHCPNCESNQPMRIVGLYPSLFHGQSAALLQCVTCGSERTEIRSG